MKKRKEERFTPDRDAIINLIKSEKKQVNVNTVLDRLKLPRSYRGTVKRIMKELANRGVLNRNRNRYASHEAKKTITGRIDLRNPFGFMENPAGGDDIFISPPQAGDLLPGDEIEIWPVKGRSGKIEGELKRIVKRTQSPIMCRVKRIANEVYAFLPFKSSPAIRLNKPEDKYKDGDLILVKVEQKDSGVYGDVVSHIYDKSNLELYKQFILDRCEIRQIFPAAALKEAQATETGGYLSARVDLRGETIITIDPVDAKDFDDAVSLRMEGGAYMLGVHIADVSHYVKEASALDIEASLRGTSVYLPGSVIPMLPEKLSNDVCSLKPGLDRMTFSIFMEIDTHGNMVDFDIRESVINSKRRFTYEEVEQIVTGGGGKGEDPKVVETLILMKELK
ncbi:MAG: RNB domain-containing ribonuclease, partial [Spirochaetia bacterium]|nr:RNB domain-containing ribonuclease [Spirochaetia bacterium]